MFLKMYMAEKTGKNIFSEICISDFFIKFPVKKRLLKFKIHIFFNLPTP